MNIRLDDKIALVTAGTKGIGFASAKLLLSAGAKVAICGRNEEQLAQSIQALSQYGDNTWGLAGDVGSLSFLESFVTEAENYYGNTVDILVNNSGGPAVGDPLGMSEEQWQDSINGNLMSVVRLCKLTCPKMAKKKWGRVINLTSTTAKEPAPLLALSNVTRAGVASFAKTLSKTVAKDGITVNTILTGGCKTDRFISLVEKSIASSGKTIEQALADIDKTVPIGYIAEPEEFAQTVLFLASEQSSYLNGVAFPVDGGASASIF